jgi:periplasmic protein TonB
VPRIVYVLERLMLRKPAFAASFVFHIGMVACAALAIRHGSRVPTIDAVLPHGANPQLIWLREPGRGGGGGGGGVHTPKPSRKVERPGTDAITVPASNPPALDPTQQVRNDVDVLEPLNIPARNTAAALGSLVGAIDGVASPSPSQGPGEKGGAGTGIGPGDGPGRGPGLGPCELGGTGGGPNGCGNGVTAPIVILRGTPHYTNDAMRARIQGPILVECVVQPSGICTDIRVVRSLAPAFGLDDEAIKATRQWRFRPGMRKDEPVPVRVTIEVMFTIR